MKGTTTPDPWEVRRSLRRTLGRSSPLFWFCETAPVFVEDDIIAVYGDASEPQRIAFSASAMWLIEPERSTRIAYDAIRTWGVSGEPVGQHEWFELETTDGATRRVWVRGRTDDGFRDVYVFLRFLLLVSNRRKQQTPRGT